MSALKTRGPLFLPLLVALCGVVFAGWNAWDGSSVPCFSAGCSLYQSFTVGGVSLWWLGVGGFSLLALLALFGQAELGRFCAGVGLLLDCVLLLIMVFTLPCFACLVIAALLALTFLGFRNAALRRDGPGEWHAPKPGRSWLLVAWSVLFALNIGLGVRETVRPWAVLKPAGGAAVHMYISPSCEACRRLVENVQAADAAHTAWYPVAENARDLAVVKALDEALTRNATLTFKDAFAIALETPELPFMDHFSLPALLLQFRLWRNQAHVLLAGSGRMPFVEFHGAPAMLLRQEPRPEPSRSLRPSSASQMDATLPVDLGLAGSCGQSAEQPCE